MRLRDANWREYSKLITWPDEPSWDCHWVVKQYELGSPRVADGKCTIPVTYNRIGLFCGDSEFRAEPATITIDYELVRGPEGWKIDAPIPDYPDLSAKVLLRQLKTAAKNPAQTEERRARFDAAIGGLLKAAAR